MLTFAGLFVYAVWPWVFPAAVFPGLLIGTVIFSMSGGFVEVLISPVIAAIPSENPDREMSKLHSVYAWAAVALTVIATLFLVLVGRKYWQIFVLISLFVPLVSTVLFVGAKIPAMQTPKAVSGAFGLLKNGGLLLCLFALFLSGASELIMSQWSSSYLEAAMKIPKIWGDIFGVACFSLTLALGRTLYARFGKNLERVLFFGTLGATACYLVAALTSVPVIGLAACALCGLSVSMLWPGTLLVASNRFPAGGIFVDAIMAASGDLGASVGPQVMGIVTDLAMKSEAIVSLSSSLGITPEQAGIKLGMLVGMIFPLIAVLLYYNIMKKRPR